MSKSNSEIVCDKLNRQYNERDLTVVDEYVSEDHFDHNPLPGQRAGREGVRDLLRRVLDNAEAIGCEIHDSITEGDLVATRYTLTTTHKGSFIGLPAAGKTTVVDIIEMDRVVNGKIVESWGEFSVIPLLRQLDALPPGLGHPHD